MVACVLCTTDVLATATACVVVSTNGMMDGYAMYYVYAIIISISTREDVVCSSSYHQYYMWWRWYAGHAM